jgi:hypothetical protein
MQPEQSYAPSLPRSNSIYEVLPTEPSFRLLELIKGGPDALPDELVYKLTQHKIKTAPGYRALSYTWGPPYRKVPSGEVIEPREPNGHVICNGCPVLVTQSLHDALKNLRDSQISGLLWIDALCINQKDIAERSAQVLLMEAIYTRAAEVIIWLGPLRSGVYDLAWAVTEFHDALETALKKGTPAAKLYATGNIVDPVFLRTLGVPDAIPRLMKIAFFYASCRWFSRAWIVQEVLLSTKARMLCGRLELSWAKFCFLGFLFRNTGWREQINEVIMRDYKVSFSWMEEPFRWYRFALEEHQRGLEYEKVEKQVSTALWNLLPSFGTAGSNKAQRKAELEEKAFGGLWVIISMARIASCFDPRDRVYSILGIAGRQFQGSPISSYIKPDYTVAPRTVFTQVTGLILEHGPKRLDLLGGISKRSSMEELHNLPSWVPDYTRGLIAQSLTSLSVQFDAALLKKHARVLEISGNTLTLSGAKFCTIEEVHKNELDNLQNPSRIESLLTFCLTVEKKAHGIRLLELIWRTMIANNNNNQNAHPAPASLEKSFTIWLATLLGKCLWQYVQGSADLEAVIQPMARILEKLDFVKQHGIVTEEDVRKQFSVFTKMASLQGEELLAVVEEAAVHRQEAFSFLYLTQLVLVGRTLFRTQLGHLGMGLLGIREGDEVWLLYGGATPFILRPARYGESYTIVGECYIQGFMHGELLYKRWGLQKKVGPVKII